MTCQVKHWYKERSRLVHPETKQVSQHMKEFGFSILGRAIYDATYCEIQRPFAH
jgi:hypothetical protein